ncbi:FG-GAP-like repeat-containing protein [Streptomyces sp. NBC_00316]|uniref:FG-GAP-like repeat-containing protein n=1 Tax=Streptomyces sp. NBC_00316 TaxID=2975710 RepID=UPI002E2C5071|nr:FG-GAP-like repeat-containing protein [Streptomyces sp. NBC_00316]
MTSVRKGLLAPLLAAAVGGAVLLPLSTGAARAESPGAEVVPTPVTTTGVWGLDFGGGVLNTVERAANGEQYVMSRRISADASSAGEPVRGAFAGQYAFGQSLERVPCDAGSCVTLVAAGNGHYGVTQVGSDGQETVQVWVTPSSLYYVPDATFSTTRIVDLTGRYAVVDAGSPATQYISGVQKYRATQENWTRKPTAAAVWGTRLWAAGSVTGALTSIDIAQKKVMETVATGAPCVIKEVRTVGRWVYWNCGPAGAAGVYDRTAKKSFTVPSGPALVGDGFLVRHDRDAGKLLLTDFHTGVAAVPREVADLPAGNTADQRRLTWAVDKFGGDIAYVDAAHSLHIVPSGVPAQPLAKIASDVSDSYLDMKGKYGAPVWSSTWQFNKPATWTYTVKDWLGRTVRTMKGGPGTEADVEWDGRTDAGEPVGNGRHTWSLQVTAEDGVGTYTTSGTVSVAGGKEGFHDQGYFSLGDLVTLNSTGGLTVQFGQSGGRFEGKSSGSGWPAGTLAVPFADTGSDRCAELLVRMPGGELRQYAGRCGQSGYTPGSSHTSIGKGWQQYDVLTSPGDLNGDGRADLVARQTATGDMYFYAGAAGGKFAARVRIFANWKTYGQITGVGDITGDGRPDLLGHDRDGGLWRYNGLGNGTFAPRVKVFSDWGRTYNSVVGIGDLSGDGKNDIVVRDSAGKLFRNDGNGKGSFGPRTQIATGWQVYKGIF